MTHSLPVARGIFGAPSFFVGEEMFWGQDRLDFVAAATIDDIGSMSGNVRSDWTRLRSNNAFAAAAVARNFSAASRSSCGPSAETRAQVRFGGVPPAMRHGILHEGAAKYARIITELSRGFRLLAGDIISTGTPDGVGFARKPPEFRTKPSSSRVSSRRRSLS